MAIFRLSFLALLSLSFTSCITATRSKAASTHTLPIATGSKATVLFWWASQCPCVSRYQSRIEDLQTRYRHLGIDFLAISSNSDDDQEEIARNVASARNLKLQLVMDPEGVLANKFNARTTPTVVLIDAMHKVRFKGWIDNERYEGDPGRVAYLENAINDILADKPVTQTSSPIYGCRITKRLR